jgi:hypothetical protein
MNREEFCTHTFIDYALNQKTWDNSKKAKYIESIVNGFYDPRETDFMGPFVVTVKKGEVYIKYADSDYDKFGRLKHDSRPRMIACPTKWGMLAAI